MKVSTNVFKMEKEAFRFYEERPNKIISPVSSGIESEIFEKLVSFHFKRCGPLIVYLQSVKSSYLKLFRVSCMSGTTSHFDWLVSKMNN